MKGVGKIFAGEEIAFIFFGEISQDIAEIDLSNQIILKNVIAVIIGIFRLHLSVENLTIKFLVSFKLRIATPD